MTTIQLYKEMNLGGGATTYVVTIDSGKVEETITKDLINFAMPLPQADWGIPSASGPQRISIDLLNINRVFTINGVISASGSDEIYDYTTAANRAPKSASEVRDILSTMQMFGGSCNFRYGVAADCTGLSADGYAPHANLRYYTAAGFECHITRLQFIESGDNGEFRNGSTYDDDYLVMNATQTYDDSTGVGSPKMGTYLLPSTYDVVIELIVVTENTS